MAKVLIVPDVHERLDRLAAALAGRIEKVDRVVFLGDWFDAFGPVDLRRVGQVCGFLNGNIDGLVIEADPGDDSATVTVPATFLLGNHDCHYFFNHAGFICSGYEPRKKEVIEANIPQGIIEKFRIYTRVGPYLLSHAGFHEGNLHYTRPEVEAHQLQIARDGGFSELWGAGYARGGRQPIGGPTWLDWSAEFNHIDNLPQIVGHTNGKQVRTKGLNGQLQSWCLDTACHHVAIVDDETGAITVEQCC